MITLSVAQLRNLLQLPERPYVDSYNFDGTPYWDLSLREPCTIFSVSGTASGSAYIFRPNIDYQLTAGSIDFTLPNNVKPDFATPFVTEYTYSRLGAATASTAVLNATMMVAQDLGSVYPYGSSTSAGISTDQLATMIAGFKAAAEVCPSLATTEIDIAQKSRRGAILLDDSKKTTDWLEAEKTWAAKYKKYLVMVRPKGMIRFFSAINRAPDKMIFGEIEQLVFDGFFNASDPQWDSTYGGIL